MFENVQFFSHLHLKYTKSANMTQKNFFLKNINMGIKNAEFYADFKFVDADLKVPKCEIFDPFFFTPINPIWVSDLRTGEKKILFEDYGRYSPFCFFYAG
jgi:hypothetical protein